MTPTNQQKLEAIGIACIAVNPDIEKREICVKPKHLSFDEPLTKEAVGKIIYHTHLRTKKIENISIDGEWAYIVEPEFISENDRWRLRKHLRIDGWNFNKPEEISIEEAEKLTGKKIKR